MEYLRIDSRELDIFLLPSQVLKMAFCCHFDVCCVTISDTIPTQHLLAQDWSIT